MNRSDWQLPSHARREQRALQAIGIKSWHALAELDDHQLLQLAATGQVSAVTLHRLRGQARLMQEVGLEPGQAALLLHAGVADRCGLAQADPQQLWVQTGRLQRRLTGLAVQPPDLATLKRWIQRARQATN